MHENAATIADHELSYRRELCQAMVTLDGRPAVIRGARLPFAHVSQYPDGVSREWSWEAVARVVRAGGAFRS